MFPTSVHALAPQEFGQSEMQRAAGQLVLVASKFGSKIFAIFTGLDELGKFS